MTGYPYTYPIVWFTGGVGSFLIDGVDYSPYIHIESVTWDNLITNKIDTCSFSLDDSATFPHWTLGTDLLGTGTILSDDINPIEESEVIILNSLGVRLFAGIIVDIQRSSIAGTKFWEVSCQDYTVLLERRLVNRAYVSKSDKEIIHDLFSTYMTEINV